MPGILLKGTDLYLFCKENITDCQILAEESSVFPDKQKTECKNITCKITTNKSPLEETAILKAPKAYIDHKTKNIFFPGKVTGSFKQWKLEKEDVLYDADKQIIKSKKTKLFSEPGYSKKLQKISIESSESIIDLKNEILYFNNGVFCKFEQ
jgi:hypothetical protein